MTTVAKLLEFKKENVKELASIIKALTFREIGKLSATPGGLRIVVGDGALQQNIIKIMINSFPGNAYMETCFFSSFVCRDETIEVNFPLKALSECLNLGDASSSSLSLSYAGFCEPLMLKIHDGNHSVKAKIHTLSSNETNDFNFEVSEIVANCILKTTFLHDFFRDLDTTSPNLVIEVSERELSFVTQGEIGMTTCTIPLKSLQMDVIACSRPVTYGYRLSAIQRMTPAIGLSNRASLRIDNRGVLNLQLMIDHGDSLKSYIEFFVGFFFN
ncbi:unnamed protein product [Caenorhabditis auriculariae]|uniref:Cell cycle checkpoint protein RAD1 n=1 Tax=Caenorhabditis auriculariae TaxID=2777116 RepID=A0A8S1I0J4_9PELO|nr:unnamed protein product [Caenorhabditis auriculariae]